MAKPDPMACAEVVLELPFLASGALDEGLRRRLEEHLEGCPACRIEAARCRAERERLRAEAAPAAAPHPAQLARLLERLDEPADDDGSEPVTRRALRLGLGGTPPAARWLIAAQLVALAGLGVWAARPARVAPPEAAFHTLSAPVAASPRGALRVVFAPETSEAELRALLLSARAEIVGGPSPAGAYTLALDAAGATEPIAEALALLRADPHVRLAEPVAGHDAPRR